MLAALHGDLGKPATPCDDDALRQPLLGAQPLWFGPRTQGVNDYETFAAIVVVGRLQPGVRDVETSARAVFSDDDQPIAVHGSGPLPATDARILLADASIRDAPMRAHPDPRAQAILAQARECGTLQAIARLRLLSPNRPKRVVILSSQPLPDVPITRLAAFAALERDLEQEPDWPGFLRLEKALRATVGRPVRGCRLSAAGLAADLPLDFETEDSAKRFRRGRSTPHLVALCGRVAAANGWRMTALLLRKRTGGKAVLAILLDDAGAAIEMARTLWPDLAPELA